jgi:hypothetical protein
MALQTGMFVAAVLVAAVAAAPSTPSFVIQNDQVN